MISRRRFGQGAAVLAATAFVPWPLKKPPAKPTKPTRTTTTTTSPATDVVLDSWSAAVLDELGSPILAEV